MKTFWSSKRVALTSNDFDYECKLKKQNKYPNSNACEKCDIKAGWCYPEP